MNEQGKTLAERVLRVTAFEYCEDLWWRPNEADPEQIDFYINCNDVFAWACADVEQITEENIEVLESTFAQCEERLGKYRALWAAILFCARVRKERPQNAWYNLLLNTDSTEDAFWREQFDACGPERSVDFGNPHARKGLRPAHPCGFGSGGYNPTCELPKGHDGDHDPIAL